jgi:hypothetical protein
MAATVSGGQTDSMFFSNWVGSSILDEARPHNVIKPLLNREGRRPGLVFNFPIQDDPGAATSNQAEGTAFTETVLTTSSQTATARLNGMVATVTDVLDAISITDAVSHFSQVLGRSVAEEFEVTAGAVFANSTGAISAETLAGFYNGLADLEAADAKGTIVGVFKPSFIDAVRAGMTTTVVGTFYGADAGAAKVNDVVGPQTDGRVGMLAGVPLYMTSATATSCLFIEGVSHGLYEVWDAKTETHRDIFQPGTQIAATSLYGVCTVRAAWSTDI